MKYTIHAIYTGYHYVCTICSDENRIATFIGNFKTLRSIRKAYPDREIYEIYYIR